MFCVDTSLVATHVELRQVIIFGHQPSTPPTRGRLRQNIVSFYYFPSSGSWVDTYRGWESSQGGSRPWPDMERETLSEGNDVSEISSDFTHRVRGVSAHYNSFRCTTRRRPPTSKGSVKNPFSLFSIPPSPSFLQRRRVGVYYHSVYPY